MAGNGRYPKEHISATIGLALLALLLGCGLPTPPLPLGELPPAPTQATPSLTNGTPTAAPPLATPTAPASAPVAPSAVPEVSPRPLATPLATASRLWRRLGLAGEDLRAVSADPAHPDVLYAGGTALWKSVDGGRTWDRQRTVRSLRDLAVSGDQVLIAASDGCARGTAAPAWRSSDGGATWRELGPNLSSLAARPDRPVLYAAGCPGILRSDDGGQRWQRIAHQENAEGLAVALSPARLDVVWAAFVTEGGSVQLQRSGDGGETWQERALPDDVWAPVHLAPHPQQPDTLYLASRSGALRTTDGGRTWTRLERGLEAARRAEGVLALYDFTAALATADLLLLATAGAGVQVSRDGGASFTLLPGYLPDTRGMALQRGDPPTLLAATADGVYAIRVP